MATYKTIRNFSYAKKLKAKPGVHNFKFEGQRVKGLIAPDGRSLKIIDASQTAVKKIKQIPPGMKLVPDGNVLRKRKDSSTSSTASAPQTKTPATAPTQAVTPPPVVAPSPASAPPAPAVATAPAEEEEGKSGHFGMLAPAPVLTDADRKAARMVPVADKGPIATPYIDRNSIPEHCKIKDISYYDYPNERSAPKGFLPLLRECFSLNRLYQHRKPTNVLISGPPGTGKTTLVRKFAEETELPYWQVIGQDGLTAEDLLGRSHMKKQKDGTVVDVWEDGIIPQAVRRGGILHFDEVNVFPPSVMLRLDELMDAKRQLNMQDLTGEIVKAHPDLFIIFTKNPDDYNGVNKVPVQVLNRSKQLWLPFAPENVELNILQSQLRSLGIKSSEFSVTSKGVTSGKIGSEIADFVKIVDKLRKNKELPNHPSMRQTIDFALTLRKGYDFKTAFWQVIGDGYISANEEMFSPAMDQVLNDVGRGNNP
jgi:MoxR-like ATPase